jgi:tRNA nucleotidyltransferase (CCA-adding enzyme)
MTYFVKQILPLKIQKIPRNTDNFDIVRKKIIEVEEHDHVRQFQPPISI